MDALAAIEEIRFLTENILPTLTPTQGVLLMHLYVRTSLAGQQQCEQSFSDWMRATGLSQQAIVKAFDRLEELRLVEITRSGKRHIPLKYRLTLGNFISPAARRSEITAHQSVTMPQKQFVTRSMLTGDDQRIYDSIVDSLGTAEQDYLRREAQDKWGFGATEIGYEDMVIRRYFGPDRLERYL